jgi:hypothetical protein
VPVPELLATIKLFGEVQFVEVARPSSVMVTRTASDASVPFICVSENADAVETSAQVSGASALQTSGSVQGV